MMWIKRKTLINYFFYRKDAKAQGRRKERAKGESSRLILQDFVLA